jgi:hypothetical protein
MAFTSVDLPTLGLPRMAMKPERKSGMLYRDGIKGEKWSNVMKRVYHEKQTCDGSSIAGINSCNYRAFHF